MALYGVSVVKATDFRGAEQPFSNVYHYSSALPWAFPEATANGVLDEVIAIERRIHSTMVRFVEARVWSAGGSKAENDTIVIRDLNSQGQAPSGTHFDPERAVLVRIECNRDDERGRKVYLRKWFHTLARPADIAFAEGVFTQQLQMPEAYRANINEEMGNLFRVGEVEEDGILVSPSGRTANPDKIRVFPYLEHHQLGDQWRRG